MNLINVTEIKIVNDNGFEEFGNSYHLTIGEEIYIDISGQFEPYIVIETHYNNSSFTLKHNGYNDRPDIIKYVQKNKIFISI